MPNDVSTLLAFRIVTRTVRNILLRRPICIALEVTHNCTANCQHCDKGEIVEDNAVGAEAYRRICEELSPAVIQIAGGEPLLREDLPEIVRALYRPDRPPYLVLVTNASLLSREIYTELREAGIKQFSISLDFPDERHSEFRRIPGLFEKLDNLVPELLALGNGDVVINTCITRANCPYLLDIIKKVSEWGAKVNFSAYTDLRTQNPEFNLRHPEDTSKLNSIIDKIYSSNNSYRQVVMTSEKVLRRFCDYFENCYTPNCQTGRRFLIVNPDGTLTPCAMLIQERYGSRKELINRFANKNECGRCYISIRANTEKSPWELLTDSLRFHRLS
ncbi:MAG: radical SAM protein [Candidatus Zixiibacteriota bacterium]